MMSGMLQLPSPDLNSVLAVQLAQKVTQEPEVHAVPWENTQLVPVFEPGSWLVWQPWHRAVAGCPCAHTVLCHAAPRARGWITLWL